VETLGRLRVLTRRMVDERVVATIWPSSDLHLADFTSPRALGAWGITAEASAGGPTATYPVTQAWALRLWEAGFAVIHYAARHDPSLSSRSVALFGKPQDPVDPIADHAEEQLVDTAPLGALAERMAEHFGFVIVSGTSL
jgi:hypothetical protein